MGTTFDRPLPQQEDVQQRWRRDRRRRALLLHRDLDFDGGVPRCFLNLIRQLDNNSPIEVLVSSFTEPSEPMVEAFAANDRAVITLGDTGYLFPAYRLRRALHANRIDVVCATSFKSYVVAKLAAKGTSSRACLWLHSGAGMRIGPAKRRLMHTLSRKDAQIYVSRAVRDFHRTESMTGASHVVYNGVEDPLEGDQHRPYDRNELAQLGIAPGAMVYAYVASFVPVKDHETLLRAFEIVALSNPDAHLLLLGGGPTETRARRLTERLATGQNRVHFLGPRPDARRWLGAVDAYVHPCPAEGFGLAIVEAMLARLPVVVTRSGAPLEFIEPGVNGLVFGPRDHEELAHQMQRLARDASLRDSLAVNARHDALERFAPGVFADQFVSAIREIVTREN